MAAIQLAYFLRLILLIFALVSGHYGPVLSKNMAANKSVEQPLECSLCKSIVDWICAAVTGKTTITSANALKTLSKVLKEECEKLQINIPDLSCDMIVGLIVDTAVPGLFNAKLLPTICHSTLDIVRPHGERPQVALYQEWTKLNHKCNIGKVCGESDDE